MADIPDRLPVVDYPSLHALLDDVAVLSFWVQRQALRWVPNPPVPEDVELGWLERYLADLERASRAARLKVEWRRKVAEVERDRMEAADNREDEWNPRELSFTSSDARTASATARPSTP